MNRRAITTIIAAALALSLSACASQPTPLPPDYESIRAQVEEIKPYYPLAVGNEWTYEGVFLGKKTRRTIKILKEEDGIYFDDGGGRLRFDMNGLRDEKRYLIKIPLREGNSWISIPSPVAAEHYRYERVEFADKVPAGVFENCITVESTISVDNSQKMTNAVTYAKGVGIIRIATVLFDGAKKIPQVKMELVGYKVGGKSVGKSAETDGGEEEVEEQVPTENIK
ncbi:MAG: hypothetical protein Kow0090_07640 [Myxococcota bacterium]